MSETTTITDDIIRELCTITTLDQAGQHFTLRYDHWEALERAGLIVVHRPVHETGVPYSLDYWTVEVTDDGQELVDAHPELHPED